MVRQQLNRSSPISRGLGLAAVVCLTVGVAAVPARAAEAPVGLGTAGSFAVLAGQSVTNTGASVVTGDIGVSPGTSVVGIPPLVQAGGALHVADAVADQAQADLVTAYDSAAGRSTVTDVTGRDLGGLTLTSGVVEHTSAMQLTGTLTLDAQGDPGAVFIFKAGSTLITAPNSSVSLINGASPCNVFWQVGSSTTLDTGTTFVGTVMSLTSATLATGASVRGRVLARNGSVTLDTNVITRPSCSPASESPSPTVTPTTTPTASASPSSTTPVSPTSTPSPSGNGDGDGSGDGGSGDGSGDGGSGDGSGDDGGGGQPTGGSQGTPVVPTGHPETGMGGDAQPAGPAWDLLWLLGGGVAWVGVLRWRSARPVDQS